MATQSSHKDRQTNLKSKNNKKRKASKNNKKRKASKTRTTSKNNKKRKASKNNKKNLQRARSLLLETFLLETFVKAFDHLSHPQALHSLGQDVQLNLPKMLNCPPKAMRLDRKRRSASRGTSMRLQLHCISSRGAPTSLPFHTKLSKGIGARPQSQWLHNPLIKIAKPISKARITRKEKQARITRKEKQARQEQQARITRKEKQPKQTKNNKKRKASKNNKKNLQRARSLLLETFLLETFVKAFDHLSHPGVAISRAGRAIEPS